MQAGNLCSRDNASRDHAFPSRILATAATVLKRIAVDVNSSYVDVMLFMKEKKGHKNIFGRSVPYNMYY